MSHIRHMISLTLFFLVYNNIDKEPSWKEQKYTVIKGGEVTLKAMPVDMERLQYDLSLE